MDPRTTLRHPVELPGTLALNGASLACTVRNVSLGGVFVCGASLTIDTRVVLRFALPRFPEIEAACFARWATEEGTGLQFDGLRAAETYALTRFIRAVERATARTPVAEILRRDAR